MIKKNEIPTNVTKNIHMILIHLVLLTYKIKCGSNHMKSIRL